MNPFELPPAPPAHARLRSGTAARLAGLPVTTLRVWERRYAVVAAPKTETGQRLYTSGDVQRLRLLKRLTDRGHAIGTIASLSLDALQGLAAGLAASMPEVIAESGDAAAPTPSDVVVVGRPAAQKLRAAGAPVRQVLDGLEAAEAAPPAVRATPLLVVQLASLQPASVERLLALSNRWQATTLVVLYGFGTEAVAETLRASGAIVRREPCTGRELWRLIRAERAMPVPAPAWQVMPRRFSDEQLAAIAELPSAVACECPRHLADLVVQLAGFERYSGECTSRSPADAAMHRHLTGLSGAARSLFEQALDRLLQAEGLEVPSDARPPAGAARSAP